jgi:hypothetical protein
MRWLRQNVLVLASLVLLATAATLAAIMLLEVIDGQPTKDTAPILAAGVALTGVLTTAAVTLFGYALRQSIDDRTARLADQAERRADVDQRRLQMETVMEAVSLLSTKEGKPAPPLQSSAALIALARLDELAMALDLAADLWPSGQLTPRAAASLCDDALRSHESHLHRAAAVLIYNNWSRLALNDGQFAWPGSLHSWPTQLDFESREILQRALIAWLEKKPAELPDDVRLTLTQTNQTSSPAGIDRTP